MLAPDQPGPENAAFTSDEMMAVAAARALPDGATCFVGIGLPSTAANLARRLHAPHLVLVYESGPIGAKPRRLPLSIGDGELADTADAVVSVPEMFNYWLQGGRIDIGMLGAAQIDRYANLNSTVIGPYEAPRTRLPGAGGAPEIAASSGEVIVVIRQSKRTFVNRVDFVTTFGHGTGRGERAKLGLPGKGPTLVVTDLALLRPERGSGELVVTDLHPGVTADQVRAATNWPVRIAEGANTTAPPSETELRALRALRSSSTP